MATLGIDFGTTKTIAAYWDMANKTAKAIRLGNGRDFLPTTIHVDSKGQLSVGDEADDQRATDAAGYLRRIKRDLGMGRSHYLNTHKFSTPQLITAFLNQVIERSEADALHSKITRLVVTVPAAYGPTKRKELESAIQSTGIPSFELLDEPVAAALAWIKMHGSLGKSVMVFDWGGGTLDVAVLQKWGEGYRAYPGLVGGDESLGGEDIDDVLIQGMDLSLGSIGLKPFDQRSDRERDLISRRVRDLKIQHTRKDVVAWSFSLEDMSEPYRWEWNRSEFNQWIEAPVTKAIKIAKTQLEAARAAKVQIDQVILVGGSSNLPLVAERMQQELGITPLRWDHSIEAVAYGAAILAHIGSPLSDQTKRFISERKAAHGASKFLIEELILIIWRNNNFGMSSAVALDQVISTITDNDKPEVICQKLYHGLNTFQKQSFEDIIVSSSGLIPLSLENMVDKQPASYIKRFPPLGEFEENFKTPVVEREQMQRQFYDALKRLQGSYAEMIKFHDQLVEFYPRYHSISNRSQIWDWVIGGLAGAFTGGLGVAAAVAWGGWRGMQDKEFMDNYTAGLQAFLHAGIKFSEEGEQIIRRQFQPVLHRWDETFPLWEEIYLQVSRMGEDLPTVEKSINKLTPETAEQLGMVMQNLNQRNDIPQDAMAILTKEMESQGVSIRQLT